MPASRKMTWGIRTPCAVRCPHVEKGRAVLGGSREEAVVWELQEEVGVS